MSSEKDKVIANLRACVISSPGGVSADALNKDYRSLVGENIPFRRLGFPTLEDFLMCIPNVDVVKRGGQWFVQAKVTGDSSHISKLVQGQKKPSKKIRNRSKFGGAKSSFNSAPRVNNYRPSQVPHFMPSPSSYSTPQKPKARYIPPASAPRQPLSFNGSRPPLLPTPTQRPTRAPLMMPTVTSLPLRAPTVASHQVPSAPPQPLKPSVPPQPLKPSVPPQPLKPSVPPQPLISTATSRPEPRPPLLPTPRLRPPSQPPAKVEPTPSNDPPTVKKTSVAGRLLSHKRSSETLPVNGVAASQLTETHTKETSPESALPPVKWVNPIAWSNKKEMLDPSPTSSFNSVDVQACQYDSSSYVLKLTRYADKQNWPRPEFFVLNRRSGPNPRYAKNLYMCRVCVNCSPIGTKPKDEVLETYEFSSYPNEFPDVTLAMDHVAKKAYDTLVMKDSIKLPETEDRDIVLQRIDELVKGKVQGVWLYQIEKMYTEKYNETLPKDLPSFLKDSRTVELSKLAESYYILRPKTQFSERVGSNVACDLTINKVSHPDEDIWDVFVSKVKSLNEIYIRIISDATSTPFEQLCEEMDAHYKNNDEEVPDFVELGKYYALCAPDDSTYRVLVTGFSGVRYQIYLVDVGDVEYVDSSALRTLLPKFYSLPAQAIPCFLDQMDVFNFGLTDPEMLDAVTHLILAKPLVAVVNGRDPLRVSLYDTEQDEDVLVNAQLKDLVLKSFRPPDILEEGSLLNIHVTSIDSEGQVWIQIPSWTLDCLNEKLCLINNGYFEVTHIEDYFQISKDKLYFYSDNPTRVKVLSILDDGKILVKCLDTGGCLEVLLQDIFELPHLDELSSKIPPQAVPILMANVNGGKLTPSEATRCLDMVNNVESPTFAKVVTFFEDVPELEIFVRNEKIGLLVSVNQNIILTGTVPSAVPSVVSYAGSQRADDTCSVSGSVVSASTNSHLSIRPLENVFSHGFILPRVNEFLDIIVTGVANPLNFTITPVKYLSFLNELGNDLIAFYNSSASSNEVYIPQIGECVAAYQGGCWFRVQVEKKIDSLNYSCRLLDHGHKNAFPSKAIRKLPEQYQKYPYLAFRAKLHGIKPRHSDWEVDDCLRIRDLLRDKKLCSVIKEIILEPDGKKLSLEIIDTTTSVDVYVTRQLIVEGRALPADK